LSSFYSLFSLQYFGYNWCMPKRPKKKTRAKNWKIRSQAEVDAVQLLLEKEKERMFSFLNFKKDLHEKLEELFNIDFNGMPEGKEPMCFTRATFEVKNSKLTRKKLEQLPDVDLAEENPPHYVWFRAYPKGHWNPASTLPGAVQILAHIDMNPDENTLKMETKTKSWMHGLINYMVKTLGSEILLVGLEFEDPLKTLREK